MRPEDERYFEGIEADLDRAFETAERAKGRGDDPRPEVEIPVAVDMADRVENILGIEGVAERVRELEGELSREEAALELVTDFVEGSVGDYDTRAGKIEGAVRTAVALLTEGVVAAPIEGIDRVELLENDDGSEFVNIYYAGPIRSAGGTAQALSVLVADYARSLLGIDAYRARADEIERYAEEVALYDRETGLQYSPKDTETKFIADRLPVMLDGEATGDEEVSGFRDLDRVDTNNPRGGMCLVLAEGIALKASKIQRYTANLDEVDWPWLADFERGDYGEYGKGAGDGDGNEDEEADGDGSDGGEAAAGEGDRSEDDDAGPPRVDPEGKYLRDLIAGRPVFGHPSAAGGFRLRYGRARNHGFATAGVHPATMHLVDDFLATGTQIKTERPGKAAGVVPVDSIEGPTVKLANGDVRRIDDPEEALELRNGVEAVLDLGEYLVNYGEFVENNHPLAPASYVREWWEQDMEAAGADVQALRDSPYVDLSDPEPDRALEWAREHDAPLHPAYTYCWHDLSPEAVRDLAAAVEAEGSVAATSTDGGEVRAPPAGGTDETVLRLPAAEAVVDALEALLVEHAQREESVRVADWRPLVRSLGFEATDEGDLRRDWTWEGLPAAAREWENAMRAVNAVAPFEVRERAPTRIGCRMGRPEKSETRELSPAVHTLFPIGEAGGSQRDVGAAATHAEDFADTPGELSVELGERACPDCGTRTYEPRCPECGTHTEPHYECAECGRVCEPDESGRVECPRCERPVDSVREHTVDLRGTYREALERVGEREAAFEMLKGVKGLSSAQKVPEPLEKGILRAKHGVSAFKDGTVRYDMTDLPVTAVRPGELDVSPEQLRALGYEEDVHGEPLAHEDQLVHLKVQDVVLSEGAAEHMLRTADFVDDLLESYYGLPSFYDCEERADLVGELVFGMAPHTSAAVVGRVVGFTSAAVGYAHPYFHAAKRRNCFHPETELWYGDENGEWHRAAITDLVEERIDPESADRDDFGALTQALDAPLEVASLDGSDSVRGEVTHVSRHPAPDHLIAVETAAGTELTVTADHTMLRFEGGRPIEVPASDLDAGDEVPAYDGGESSQSDGVPREEVVRAEPVSADAEYVYCLTVADTHTLAVEGIYAGNCDGDEDCVMLLMDGLLNFSQSYLPDQRGGRMDAPLVMSSRIDPSEIDDEAHNVDIDSGYSRAFYEATREMADPGEVEVTIAEETLGTDREYAGFDHTHDTTDVALGPDLSAYKTLGSMEEKMDAQLALSRKLRAVEESDVAERIIEYHFLPDLIGNLRAFSRQEVRCMDCGRKYRRMPLTGDCRDCGGDVNLTVHQGSVNKYMDTAISVAEEFDCREYTKQRLEILRRRLDRIFENDKNKASSLSDFM